MQKRSVLIVTFIALLLLTASCSPAGPDTLDTPKMTSDSPMERVVLPKDEQVQEEPPKEPVREDKAAPPPEEKGCDDAPPVFTHAVTDMDKVTSIQTPPMIVNGDLKTHSYIETNHERVPVYAPADMTLTGGSFYVQGPYALDFRVTCDVTLRYAHITDPIDEIKEVFPNKPKDDSRTVPAKHEISFKAGDLIGHTTGTPQAGNWDFGVYNAKAETKYKYDDNWMDSWVYDTAVCPYAYFTPELKAEYEKRYDKSAWAMDVKDGESFCG